MISLIFLVIFSVMAMIMVLLFENPIRKLVIMGLDRMKRGRGPLIVTMPVRLLPDVYSMIKIQKRGIEDEARNPTDQVLMARHLLEATLMGAVIVLLFMIDRLHHCITEIQIRRKSLETATKQIQGAKDGKFGSSEEMKTLEEESAKLRAEVKRLESEVESKTKDAEVAEANGIAERKQSEGILLEYDRLL